METQKGAKGNKDGEETGARLQEEQDQKGEDDDGGDKAFNGNLLERSPAQRNWSLVRPKRRSRLQ
jgi:hypothetical protein